ncbi:Flavohemoprotein [Penicillium daleae]|uniref:nitric oxide dioxygenase n=1 Tax=Penicillium daleae TaxID=63821 RepID=A0AAD6BY34_9EURO|nr:Flavohemoprotein [Penicillium daleae]KAJ5433467.1 Flavohemoprotein [Penicillium daleae]
MGSVAGLTPGQLQLIKATVPVLVEHGQTITTVFYKNMLAAHPELNNIFNVPNQRNGHQTRALAGALFAYAANIDNLGALGPAVELICNKHASLYIQPEQYQIVGKHLIEAMGEVLGDALTAEIKEAWGVAYWQLADIMIGREKQIYEQSKGWNNWREFKITEKVQESEEITSFYLAPVDCKPLPPFQPGQYISVQVNVRELQCLQPRQYSLSDQHSQDYYRISVKKEKGLPATDSAAATHPGYVSNLLHDQYNKGDIIKVSHPCGDFFLSATAVEPTTPVVLLSAGVGLTPMTSILNTLTSKSACTERKLHFIHGARNSRARAFKDHLTELKKTHTNLQATFFTSNPSEAEKEGVNFDHVGRVDLSKLDASNDLLVDIPTTEYYICGPDKFMTDMQATLKENGVSADRIKMELFGTGGIN